LFLKILLPFLGEKLIAEISSSVFGTLWVTDGLFQAKRHLRSGFFTVQTVLDCRDPRRPRAFPLKVAAQALEACPVPGDVLVLGLGGGAFAHVALTLRPGAKIAAIEADPAVAEAARLYFGLPPGVEVAVGGALEFLRGAMHDGKRFAFAFVDIFDRTHTPAWLGELAPLVKGILLPGGAAVVNTTRLHPFDRKQGAVAAAFRAEFPNVRVRRFPPVSPRNEVLVCWKTGK
jgi:spermidine synthase